MTAIETENLTKRFGQVNAVDGIDLSVAEGEVFGFLGPNGAGKSTTINVLLDFVRPTSGSARIFGHDTQTETVPIRHRVGVLPEGYGLYSRLSGRRHVEQAIEHRGADDDPEEILDRVGLDPADTDRQVGGYSQGMRQRLVLGMALVGDPDLLILDEPTSGLDPNGARMLRGIVEDHADSGGTVFFSSHILEQVQAVSDRVAILNEGRVVAVDSIEGLRREVGTGSTLSLTLDGVPAVDLSSVPGVSHIIADGDTLQISCAEPGAKIRAIDRVRDAGATVEDITTAEASLEDLFAAYTTESEAGAVPETAGGRN